jgi:flagellar motor switch/type III secretory pathway protein FliN
MSGADLLALSPGDVIVLDRNVGEPLDVQVNGSSKFGARLTRVERKATLVVERVAAAPDALALEGAA